MRRLRRFSTNAVVAAVLLACAAVAVDVVAFYVLDIKPAGYEPERFFEFSPQLGHVHKPNARGPWYRYLMGEKYQVSTNSHGFADDERTYDKTRPRIALIGDSTTEFWEVDEPDRGQYVLEKLLGGRFEVLNFGVRVYATDQTYLLFTLEGIKFHPDIVVYTFCVNDIAENAKKEGKPYFEHDGRTGDLVVRNYPVKDPRSWKKFGAIYEHSFVYRLIEEARNQLMPGMRLKRLLGRDARPEPHFELRCYKKDYSDSDRERMDVTLGLISRMNEFMKDRGMRFLVVEGVYKPMDDPKTRRQVVEMYGDIFDPDKVTHLLEAHCEAESIPFLSIKDFANERGVVPASLMHPRDNMHLDAVGVRFYCEAVASKLSTLGWLAAANAIPEQRVRRQN